MSTPGTLPKGLPQSIRLAALVCAVLSGLTGISSCGDAMRLEHLSEEREASANRPGMMDPKVEAQVHEAHFAALEQMRESRSLLLGALSLVCALAFVSAARLLRPAGLPLEAMRQMLGVACMVAAVLRTIDGAQLAVVMQRTVQAMHDAIINLPEAAQEPQQVEVMKVLLKPELWMGLVAFYTALMAGGFLLLGQYFRSERVRQVISAHDSLTE